MKNNKLMKLLLSFLMVLTIGCTNLTVISTTPAINNESHIQLLEDEPEDSILGNWKKQ